MNFAIDSKQIKHEFVKLCWYLELAPSTSPIRLTSVSSQIAYSTQRALGRICYKNCYFPGTKLPYMIFESPTLKKRVSAKRQYAKLPHLLAIRRYGRLSRAVRTDADIHWRGILALTSHWMWG